MLSKKRQAARSNRSRLRKKANEMLARHNSRCCERKYYIEDYQPQDFITFHSPGGMVTQVPVGASQEQYSQWQEWMRNWTRYLQGVRDGSISP